MSHPPEGSALADQELSAPDMAVRPVSGPVKDHGDAALQPVLRHHGSRMGMMMLHPQQRAARLLRQLLRKLRRQVAWMQIADQSFRPDAEQSLHPGKLTPEGLVHAKVFHVSKILAQIGPVSGRKAERRLQISPEGQKGRPVLFPRLRQKSPLQKDRRRHEAPAPSEHLHMACRDPHQRIV